MPPVIDRERIDLEPGLLLHRRPYRDNSLLLEVFTASHGRTGLVARGGRGGRGRGQGLLQPFQPLLLSWRRHGELGTLTGAEAQGSVLALKGLALFSGFYVNELMLRLLRRDDPHPELFELYHQTLKALARAGETDPQPVLRLFEKRLLEGLGYGLLLDVEADSGMPVEAGARYRYELERGPVRDAGIGSEGIQGASLLALARENLEDERTLQECRRLLRRALALYLGDRPLKTREVLAALLRSKTRSPTTP